MKTKMTPKVFYIVSKEFDYQQDMIYNGLRRIVGVENIKEYPYRLRYHIPNERYPKTIGNDGWVIKGRNFSLEEADLIVVGSAKPETFYTYSSVLDKIPKKTPVVFVDGGDWSELGGDLKRMNADNLFQATIAKRNFDLILKREYLLSDDWGMDVIPAPFCYPANLIPNEFLNLQKLYDLSFWAVESHPIRTQVLSLIEDKYDCRQNGTKRNQVFKKYKRKGLYYLKEISRCKIVLNFRGVGWDTLRFWEVPALSTFLLSQKPQIRIPNPFVHEESIVYVKDNLSDLFSKIDHYLHHDDRREQIAARGLDHLNKFHTCEKRALSMLESLFG